VKEFGESILIFYEVMNGEILLAFFLRTTRYTYVLEYFGVTIF